jgi:hypothetical protein
MSALLQPIDAIDITKEQAFDLWEHVRQQKLCFDDFTRDRADVFLSRIMNPSSAAFQCDAGLVLIESIVPRLSAEIHFYMWKPLHDVDIVAIGNEACREVFTTHKVHRLSAYPPAFNRLAQRIAMRLGFKWEGNIRQQFLYENRYHDILVYGLLAQEFAARGGR